MKISMLMATLNRRSLMLTAIDSILKQTYQDFEIIVIDQSDEDNSDILNNDKRIKYVHITQKGLSHARNVGLDLVEGDIVGLMDDDALYSENVLENINQLFENDKSLGLVAGAVVDINTNKISLRGMGDKQKKIKKSNIFKCCISPSMFIKSDILLKIRFDENFGIGCFWGSAEETDVALKVLYNNYKAVFCPSIIVYHPGSDKMTIPLEKVEKYSRGFGAVCAKHRYSFNNRTMTYLYFRALFRAFVGYNLSLLKFSSHMKRYYKCSINGKKEGYKSYKKFLKESKNDS